MSQDINTRKHVTKTHRFGDDNKQPLNATTYAKNLEQRLAKATAENDKLALVYLHQEAKVVLGKLQQNMDGLQKILDQAEASS